MTAYSSTPPRIVSLIPSATEIVCALGFESALVGRSHECDVPASVARLPVCTETTLNINRSSSEIHRDVTDLLRRALSVYRVDVAALERLRPTHIVTQTQCEVCAVSLKDVEAALDGWRSPGGSPPALIPLAPTGLAEVWNDIRRVAGALGASNRGDRLVDALQARMERIRQAIPPGAARPTVACIEWIEPLMAAGNWMPELVDMAGGNNRFGEAGAHSPWMDWDALIASDPDVIIVLPCGFSIDRTQNDLHLLSSRPEWKTLRAVAMKRVFLADGNQFFNRPGPRLVESLEILAEIIHPELVHFGHQGRGWIHEA